MGDLGVGLECLQKGSRKKRIVQVRLINVNTSVHGFLMFDRRRGLLLACGLVLKACGVAGNSYFLQMGISKPIQMTCMKQIEYAKQEKAPDPPATTKVTCIYYIHRAAIGRCCVCLSSI
jgi:hypothetical protein